MKENRLSTIYFIWYLIVSNIYKTDETKKRKAIIEINSTASHILSRPYDAYDTRPMNFLHKARKPEFRIAIDEMRQICGTEPMAHEDIWGGAFFQVNEQFTKDIIIKYHTEYLKKDIYLFCYEETFNMENIDIIGILPTDNRYAVVNAIQTNGENNHIRTWDIINWLKKLQSIQSFYLIGIGVDFIEGFFIDNIGNPFEIAKLLMDISCDALDSPYLKEIQNPSFGDLATSVMKNRKFHISWD